MFFNPADNTGYLASKLKNANVKKHRIEGTSKKVKKTVEKEIVLTEETNNLSLSQELWEFFKHCDAVEQESLIEKKLQESLQIRRKIIESKTLNVYETFPFYLFNSNLVSIYNFT